MPRQPRYAQIFRDSPEMAEMAAQAWKEVVEHLEGNGWTTPRRLDIADRYARACAEYQVLYPIAASEGPVKLGPNGGEVFNFNWSAVEKLNDRLAKFEKALLLAPDSEGVEPGKKLDGRKKSAADTYLDA